MLAQKNKITKQNKLNPVHQAQVNPKPKQTHNPILKTKQIWPKWPKTRLFTETLGFLFAQQLASSVASLHPMPSATYHHANWPPYLHVNTRKQQQNNKQKEQILFLFSFGYKKPKTFQYFFGY
ncbi:hypothetical protein ES332_A06G165000v1 [Gossypium tomentosum]|uniref:Uncharacterized protein n=1 Tax=Gossypium tomentosum TaxID=34277 RepID=A0A5D2Q5L9_GOSTO|nr:hypothetical protein ES332_A06G165000v1 [Gossypium tomentosum]